MQSTHRLKRTKQLIRITRFSELVPGDFVYPLFITERKQKSAIPALPGQYYHTVESAISACNEIHDLGIPAIMIFGLMEKRNKDGSVALEKSNFGLEIFERLKREFGDDLVLISNVCLCMYTEDESCAYHDGNKILCEETGEMLGKISVAHAEVGADMIAPAAMVDGQVRHIRRALDSNGFDEIPIMSYIKADSCLYEPFFYATSKRRRKEHASNLDTAKLWIDPMNQKMFARKIELDIKEGADAIIIKPATFYLDIVKHVKERYNIATAAYQVSGEYMMIKSASNMGCIDETKAVLESLRSIKRAGADMIITYYALEAAKLLQKGV